MALVKKVDSTWSPSEKRDLKVGEVIEITDYVTLVRTGAAILVDEQGNELSLPDQVFTCPVCFKESRALPAFIAHVDTHKRASVVKQPEVTEPVIVSALEEAKNEVKVEEPVVAPLYVSKKTLAAEEAKKGTIAEL